MTNVSVSRMDYIKMRILPSNVLDQKFFHNTFIRFLNSFGNSRILYKISGEKKMERKFDHRPLFYST